MRVDGQPFTLGRYDALYVPRDATVEVAPSPEGCDLAEIAAPVTEQHPVQFVPFAATCRRTPGSISKRADRRRSAS